MNLIPVVDVLGGQVVRGVLGNRQAYQPIVSALCGSSDPVRVAKTLVEHCDARRMYVADLDVLTGGTPQLEVVRALLQALPGVELWVDAGFDDADAAQAFINDVGPGPDRVATGLVPVFGSESLRSRAALAECHARFGPAGAVLSLDRRGGQRLDAAGCWDAMALWPRRVIMMTLERVGSGAGPDLDTMADLHRRAPSTELIGAGGVRSPDDLERARGAGASAWLVASALHDLQLPPRRATLSAHLGSA